MIRLGDGIMAAEGDPGLFCTGDLPNQQQLTCVSGSKELAGASNRVSGVSAYETDRVN